MTSLLMIVAGAAILIFSGDALVRGAVALALKAGLSVTFIALTVVALGTSVPELIVCLDAAFKGSPDIATGNIVGSNIANLWLVLGAGAVLVPLIDRSSEFRTNYWYLVAASVLLFLIGWFGILERWMGLVLLAALGCILFFGYRKSRGSSAKDSDASSDIDEADSHMPAWKLGGFIIAGIVGLPIGAELLVNGAQDIARIFKVSEAAIGLTVVALGTSLPELAATVMAALRGRGEVALGNAIGSNLFNILGVLGGTGAIIALPFSDGSGELSLIQSMSLPVMMLATLCLLPFILPGRAIGRTAGVVFLFAYGVFTWLSFSVH